MRTNCPRCLRSLSTADPGGPPSFCMYCGQKLRDDAPTATAPALPPAAGDMVTTDLVPFTDRPDEADARPAEVGGYRLGRKLGAGGMGTVYEAEAAGTGAKVAVKLLSPRLASNPASVERFRQEGRLASQLSHPRCVFVLAADTDAGRPYIVMELMPGRTLKDLVDERGPLPPAEAVAHTLDVIDGLTEAHRLGVLHRDVKPSNCFLTADGRVKVGDFGLSKSLAGSADRQITQSGAFLGTVLFASPEQLRSEPLDYASDVYSVCATLYYLLCGEAPYHHESVTAALLKTAEGPPDSLCAKRPAVSRALERAVLRGLEQSRDRRWQTLDELREALAALLPSRQVPARPRALAGAYILDSVLLIFLVQTPVELLEGVFGGRPVHIGMTDRFDPIEWGLYTLYFALLEGIWGTTVGKRLLGLRVSRVEGSGPPGVGRALARAAAFNALWLAVFYGGPLAIPAVVALLYQLRRTSGGYRGVHDFLSGCHVTRRPHPARKLRLNARGPTPLDALAPDDPAAPLPGAVGGFTVKGRVWAGDGEEVWAAEDRALGRRVLLWLRAGVGEEPGLADGDGPARPARLRRLGRGRLGWNGREWGWAGFAAPAGCPLAAAVRPGRPLPWADARSVVEQLADELTAATADGTLPDRVGLDQVWVDPAGRVQVVDCPMTATRNPEPGTGSKDRSASASGVPRSGFPVPGSLGLLRSVASLALEGRPRTGPGRVRAPVPPHAAPVLDRLFAKSENDGYADPGELSKDLHDTHAHPPEVTPGLRAAQLGIQAAFLSVGLIGVFAVAGVAGTLLARAALERAGHAAAAAAVVRATPPPAEAGPAADRLDRLRDAQRAEFEARRAALFAPQRLLLDQFDQANADRTKRADDRRVAELVEWATADGADTRPPPSSDDAADVASALAGFMAGVLVAWMIGAFVFRGGLSMRLAGVAVVRPDGRRAARWRCGLRAGLVWLPVVALLAGSVGMQAVGFRHPYLAAGLWLAAVALLPVYVVVALKDPARPPQDRIAGTHLVPE